jgi:hypothetical protein
MFFTSSASVGLLGFLMIGVLPAKTAVLAQLDPVGRILLVLHGVVVPLLALGASQHNLLANGVCHLGHLLPEWGLKRAHTMYHI